MDYTGIALSMHKRGIKEAIQNLEIGIARLRQKLIDERAEWDKINILSAVDYETKYPEKIQRVRDMLFEEK